MSQAELDRLIGKIHKELGTWLPGISVPAMRESWDRLFMDVPELAPVKKQVLKANGVPAEWLDGPGARSDRAVLYLHGGGYVLGGINSHRDLMARISADAKARVLGIDYRLAPEHPFPAAVDDAVSAYRFILDSGITPNHVAIAGDSAGGGLTAATLLAIRDKKLPLPACAALLSPWVDLEGEGQSMNGGVMDDPMVRKDLVALMAPAYLNGKSARDPLASPLHANLSGLPPLLVQVGRREVLLDDSTRFAQAALRAGVKVELEVWPGMLHVWQLFASELEEGREAIARIGGFLRSHFG
ncbi:MAG TPA: alpha/beta hydrolase [Myxococcota bacterium]|nr:alpha/beta hydrolase [Myxococcota bacterium]